MEWRDEGALLAVRRHGETSAIIEVFTAEHGRHLGVVRGGTSRKIAPILQPGAQLDVTWRARLEDHIGSITVEPLKSRAGVMGDRLALAGLNAVCALCSFALPERESHPGFYRQTLTILDMLGSDPLWRFAYLKWEMALLEEMGFGLDLTACAVTGQTEGLIYVSPRTGRAVSEAGAGAYADRLLPLSPAMRGEGAGADADVRAGLRTTGHFLEVHLAASLGDRPVPEARRRFVERL